MDVDLSTDLDALLPLVAPLLSGHSDVAIGTPPGAAVARVRPRPQARGHLAAATTCCSTPTLRTGFSDAQCGFKAVRADVAAALLPLVEDDGVVLRHRAARARRAQRAAHPRGARRLGRRPRQHGWRSSQTATDDLRGVLRLGRGLRTGALPIAELRAAFGRSDRSHGGLLQQVLRFAAVGVASTVAYAVLFVLLHPSLGGQGANAVALSLTAVANTAANRRFTFEVRGRTGVARHQLQGLAVFGAALAITAGALALVHLVTTSPGRGLELTALVLANLLATALRFVALRGWVFRKATS